MSQPVTSDQVSRVFSVADKLQRPARAKTRGTLHTVVWGLDGWVLRLDIRQRARSVMGLYWRDQNCIPERKMDDNVKDWRSGGSKFQTRMMREKKRICTNLYDTNLQWYESSRLSVWTREFSQMAKRNKTLTIKFTAKSVHSFSKCRVHKFGNGLTNGRTNGLTDGRTDGQVENIMPPAILHYRRH